MGLSIAVVTKRAGITLTLRSKVHDLIEIRPTGSWLARDWPEDVVVLDLTTPSETSAAIEELRAVEESRPIVVISGEDDQWADVSHKFTDLLMVPLPVTAATLLDTVDRAAAVARQSLPIPSPSQVEGSEPSTVVVERPAPPTQTLDPAPPPEDGAAKARAKSNKHRAPRKVPASVIQAHPDEAAQPELASSRVVHFVELLLRDVSLLPRLAQTADVVRRNATAAVPADASVVLVPDGEIWRVEAGHNLRPLEERLQIDATHWLASEIARLQRGVVIRNTDIARNRLAGAPLASWANWLAIPVEETEVILVLTREVSAFAKSDVTRATKAIAPLADEVRHAIAVRTLARALSDFRDLVD